MVAFVERHYNEVELPELQEWAADIGMELTPEDLAAINSYPVTMDGDGNFDWPKWRKGTRSGLREVHRQRQAEKSPAREAAGTLGIATRPSGGALTAPTWQQAQKITSIDQLSDEAYEKLVAG